MNIDKRLVRKDSLEKLFDILKQNRKTIYAPFTKNGKITFRTAENFAAITTGYIQTTESSKDVAFPRVEKLLDYSKNKEGMSVKGIDFNEMPEVVAWGVRPCDAVGVKELSSIFNWDYKDEIYNNRLSKVIIFGFSCNKSDDYCFCTSVGGNPGNTNGSDILFTMQGDEGDYLAEIITEKGQMIVTMAPALFEISESGDKEKYLADVPVRFNHEEIREKLDKFFESKEWVDQSLRCLGCGACAYVCPTCACFDIQDRSTREKGITTKMLGFMRFFTFHDSYFRP